MMPYQEWEESIPSFERTAGHQVQAMIELHFNQAASGVVLLRPAAPRLGRWAS